MFFSAAAETEPVGANISGVPTIAEKIKPRLLNRSRLHSTSFQTAFDRARRTAEQMGGFFLGMTFEATKNQRGSMGFREPIDSSSRIARSSRAERSSSGEDESTRSIGRPRGCQLRVDRLVRNASRKATRCSQAGSDTVLRSDFAFLLSTRNVA